MNKITGNGRPTVHTHGEVGQYYEDLETGDIYECRRSSEFSPLHGAPVGGYIWELRMRGEDRREHLTMLGSNALTTAVFRYQFSFDLMGFTYIFSKSYSEIRDIYMNAPDNLRVVYLETPGNSENTHTIIRTIVAETIEQFRPLSAEANEYMVFTFRKPDGTALQIQFNPDDTVTEITE